MHERIEAAQRPWAYVGNSSNGNFRRDKGIRESELLKTVKRMVDDAGADGLSYGEISARLGTGSMKIRGVAAALDYPYCEDNEGRAARLYNMEHL